jgi:hypothetical protein
MRARVEEGIVRTEQQWRGASKSSSHVMMQDDGA